MRLAPALVAALLTLPVGAATLLRVCAGDQPHHPYVLPPPAPPGTVQILVDMTAQAAGVRLRVEYRPWRRCQEEVRAGRQDALLSAAALPYNFALARFPMRNGKVDTRRAVGAAVVRAARRASSTVNWDGKRFSGLQQPVAISTSYVLLRDIVQRSGTSVDDGGKTLDENLGKLVAGRVDLVLDYENDLQAAIARHFSRQVVMLPTPISQDFYYLAFSRQFYATHGALAERFWDELARQLESPAYRQRTAPR